MQIRESPTLAVLGNLTIDEVVDERAAKTAPGGSALYVSATAAFLGVRVRVVSNIGPDYPSLTLTWLQRKGIDVGEVRNLGTQSTRFKLSYRMGFRTLRVVHGGSPLGPDQVRRRSTAIHLGPVFGEVPLSIVPVARRHSGFLSMDMQGFLRRRDGTGEVHLRPTKLGPLFRSFDLVKATEEEALVQTSSRDVISAAKAILRHGPRHLVVTMGKKGAILAEKNGGTFRVPAYPESNVVDPTGAGDALVGGWLATFLSTRDPIWAASVGSALASLLVRRLGLAKFRLSRRELFRKSAWIFSRVRAID